MPPAVAGRSLVALVVSNLLYSLAFTLYFYITHLGYRGRYLPYSSDTCVIDVHHSGRAIADALRLVCPLIPLLRLSASAALPFLHKTEMFLYPITLAVFTFVLFLTLGLLGESYRFQGTRIMASLYFSH